MDVMLSIFGPTCWEEDFDVIAGRFRQVGGSQMLFFTSLYHGYRLLQPRYPQRAIYTLETDRVFYDPDLSLYEDSPVRPERSLDAASTDWVAGLSQACRTEGVAFIPLIPMCAGERLVQQHPDLAVRNLYGSADRLFMCYNNPVVRAYRLAMVQDVVGRYDLDGLMLDKVPQIMLEQRAFNGLFDPPLRVIGSFCFCEHCRTAAARADLDLSEVRVRCLELARRSLRMPPHVLEGLADQLIGDTEVPLLLLEEPLIREMLEFRFRTAVAFVAEVRALVRRLKPRIPLYAAFVPPVHIGHDMTSPRSWLAIQSYKFYAEALDGILCVVHWDADVVRFETQRAVEAAEGKTEVTASMRLYGPTRPQDVPILAEAALAGGSKGLSFLGYDVATDELLDALGNYVHARGD
ncbi:MAG TPA: hypothetical protein VMZ92_10420 [Planctomycetota bacterium]|nr:hypothetical protein [Planctomycetota bacterium]